MWSGDGRLKGVAASLGGSMQTESRFWYGPDGGRVAKSTTDLGTGATSMNQRFGDFFEWVDDGSGTESWTLPISLGDRILAQHDVELSSGQYTEEVRWVAGDHLGSASIITDELGDLWVGRKYEPYGRERAAWGPGAAEGENDLGSVERRFNGKQRELDAMGLAGTPYELEGYDYGARYYLPEFGSWMSADSITPDNVGEFNAFQYVASNPLSYRDPTGHSVATKILKLILKGGDVAATFADLVAAVDTLLDSDASWVDRGIALATLASEVGPISIGDIKDAKRAINAIDAQIDAVRSAKAAEGLASTGGKAMASGGGGGRRLYRTMKEGADGRPEVGRSARTLGARTDGKRVDIEVDRDGLVHPGTGGMSVTPDDPNGLPSFRKPAELGGTSKDPLWSIDERELGPDIDFRADPDRPLDHGFVEPGRPMTEGDYQGAICNTADCWRRE